MRVLSLLNVGIVEKQSLIFAYSEKPMFLPHGWFTHTCMVTYILCMYVAEYSCEVLVGGGSNKRDDIQVENNSSEYNDIVEIAAGQAN